MPSMLLRPFILAAHFTLTIIFIGSLIQAQTIPAARLSNWSHAGLRDSVPVVQNVVDFSLNGGVGDGVTVNNVALQSLLNTVTAPAVIYFSPGNYLFTSALNLPDGIVLRGAGADQSVLTFNLNGGGSNLISINGSATAVTTAINSSATRHSNFVVVANASQFNVGDYVYIKDNDSSTVFSSWAYGSSGQVNVIDTIISDTIVLRDELRRNYYLNRNPVIKKILPASFCGIECLKIDRLDATVSQTSAIAMTYARDCWVKAVESNNCNFAHVEISWSTDIEISGSYFHHAFAYGGGGQGYGVAIQYASGNCLITNNCFNHLRHSILFQAGANGNVASYNYSTDPYWSSFPSNSAGDIVMHGNYPYCNLVEGNIAQNIVVDASHGINGPDNLFFRNRAELYGILMSTNPASDSVMYAGNEVTNTGFLMGNYTLNGNGHFQYGNNIRGTITPANTNVLPEESYYLTTPPTWLSAWPGIGTSYPYNMGTVPAKTRFNNQIYTDCNAVLTAVQPSTQVNEVVLFPSLCDDYITISGSSENYTVSIFDISGKRVLADNVSAGTPVNIEMLAPGMYSVLIEGNEERSVKKIVKQ
jgi:hypothetical protein